METSIVIPAMGNKHLTIKCFETLEGVDQIIIIDDNGGFAETVNKGLSIADGKYIIVCNNDVEFIQPDWLDHLLGPLKNGYDICSIKTSDNDGYLTEDRLEEGAKFGSLWAMRREVYDAIGPMEESFGKGYFEDLDFHKRAEDAGFKVVKNHAGLVDHIGKATFKEVDPNDEIYEAAKLKFKEKWGRVW